jgi:hypothetical protein
MKKSKIKRSQKIELIKAGIGLIVCVACYTPMYIMVLDKFFA